MPRDERRRRHESQLVDEASAESFPASDPPSFIAGHAHDPAVRIGAGDDADVELPAPQPTHEARLVDEASAQSFPASDPPSFAAGHAHDPSAE